MKSSFKCLMHMTELFEEVQLRWFTNKIHFFINYVRLVRNSKLDTFSLFVLYPEVHRILHIYLPYQFLNYVLLDLERLNRMTVK